MQGSSVTEIRRPTDRIRLTTAVELPIGMLASRLSAVLLNKDVPSRTDYIKSDPNGKNVQLTARREGDAFIFDGPDGIVSTDQLILGLDMEGDIEGDSY